MADFQTFRNLLFSLPFPFPTDFHPDAMSLAFFPPSTLLLARSGKLFEGHNGTVDLMLHPSMRVRMRIYPVLGHVEGGRKNSVAVLSGCSIWRGICPFGHRSIPIPSSLSAFYLFRTSRRTKRNVCNVHSVHSRTNRNPDGG